MKVFFTILLCLFSTVAVLAQTQVYLHISPKMGEMPFALNETAYHPDDNTDLKFTRFDYYLSGIKIKHDGGQITPLTDLHFLVHGAMDSVFNLGILDLDLIEEITFSVGVDSAHNHLDPASYEAKHPLANQVPNMNWGWSAGYRFAAIEGYVGTNTEDIFQFHALGDVNYKTITLSILNPDVSASEKTIKIEANYANAIKSIHPLANVIVHGETGAAIVVMNNFKNNVFSTMTTSQALNTVFSGAFSVSPNPVMNGSTIAKFELVSGSHYEVTITDIMGKTIQKTRISPTDNQLVINDLNHSGLYFVHLWQDGIPVCIEKLTVVE
jgi:Secretion system C-terminal sorting domain